MFSIDSAQTMKTRCFDALVPKIEQGRAINPDDLAPKIEQEKVTSSIALGHKVTSLFLILGDQYYPPTFIVQVLIRK